MNDDRKAKSITTVYAVQHNLNTQIREVTSKHTNSVVVITLLKKKQQTDMK